MPMKSAVTVSLVPEARGGPFVFWDDLEAGFAAAARHGFDAVEIFPPGAGAIAPETVRPLMETFGLPVAAVGTGAGWVAHRLHLTLASADDRARAKEFALGIVHAAGALGAPAIIGSMQGRSEGAVMREQALEWLGEGLEELATAAATYSQPLFYEPLNRYETNLFHRLEETATFLRTLRAANIRLLADLFHMNIDESSISDALRAAGPLLGHVHFADSNRQAIGFGHTAIEPIIDTLRELGYAGYLSAEILPLPTSEAAATQTMLSFRRHVAPA